MAKRTTESVKLEMSRKDREAKERAQELRTCLVEIGAILDKYEATFAVTRIVRVDEGGVERVTHQVSTVDR